MTRKVGYHFGDKGNKHMHKKKIHQSVDRKKLWEVRFSMMFLFSMYYSIMSNCFFGHKEKMNKE